ncbi:cold shock domain-containing protein [Paenactinomyces guangxiensis]|uniref:Cold shock domain-containing protein n=1 Tax=Paenactinomyces guangxiensis TaxID=1490290 RepID=A0A7W1WUP2_9BACL|nr:cold shock domain-containing protein [Paenactinomyces guangxiensis]MBA4496318.1 cold shock domain-containing protein [Paenactinomyces guangxiensis]MBH8590847.1 cold shock domain-containing protein [Paenactinomyces guangxiensis]
MSTNPYLYGEVTHRTQDNKGSAYIIKDNEGKEFFCRYLDILTEGFRQLYIGDKVRFIPAEKDGKLYATYIVKLSDIEFDEDFIYK